MLTTENVEWSEKKIEADEPMFFLIVFK